MRPGTKMTCDDLLLMLFGVLATFVGTVVAILVIPGFAILMDRLIKLRGSLDELEKVLIRLEEQFKEFSEPDFKGYWPADADQLRYIYDVLGRLKEGFPVIGSRLGGIPVLGAADSTVFDWIQWRIGDLITFKVSSDNDEKCRAMTKYTWEAIKDEVAFLHGCVDNLEYWEQTKKFFVAEVCRCYKVLWKHLWLISYGPRLVEVIRRVFKSS
jgi:hypothetical protein